MSSSRRRGWSPIEARIDLDALSHNVRTLRRQTNGAALMAVVKADAYGHGMLACAAAAQAAGAEWLGTTLPSEAVSLRRAGLTARILAWHWTPGQDLTPAVAADIDLSVSSIRALDNVISAAECGMRQARVHLKVDSGLGRGGAMPHDWVTLVRSARKAHDQGRIRIVGVWSHLASGDQPDHPSVAAQIRAFTDAVDTCERMGVRPEVRHLANSPASLLLPETHFDLIRVGGAMYGLVPGLDDGDAARFRLRPVMSLVARVAELQRGSPWFGGHPGTGTGVATQTTIGVVTAGYGDGLPRSVNGSAQVLVGGVRRPVLAPIDMNHLLVDLGESRVVRGDDVVLFGSGDLGEPTAEEWAVAAGTISYEIVTRIAATVPRVYVGGGEEVQQTIGYASEHRGLGHCPTQRAAQGRVS